MSHRVAAFYQFAALPDFQELREPLRAICAELRLKGSVLLAHEGINGTLAGSAEGIAALVEELQRGALFGGRLDNLELKSSHAAAMPFQRLKIRLKKEIVTLGCTETDPTRQVGIYVDPAGWNALIASADTLVIDTRNAFEVAMGTFPGAVDPGIQRGQRLSARAWFCRGLSPQGRHPQISRGRSGSREPLARRMFCLRRPRRARPRLAGAPDGAGFR